MSEIADALNTCECLDLMEISHPGALHLRLIVGEAKVQKVTTLSNASRLTVIATDKSCRIFRVEWKFYVGYSIRNESWARKQSDAVYTGKHFVRYSVSNYLDFIKKSTIDLSEVTGEYYHWGFFCLNHIVDVVAGNPPEITQIQ